MKRLSHKMIIVWHDWSNKANFHILLPVAGPELVVRMDTFGRAAASSSWHSMVPVTPRCQWVTAHWAPLSARSPKAIPTAFTLFHSHKSVLWILNTQGHSLTSQAREIACIVLTRGLQQVVPPTSNLPLVAMANRLHFLRTKEWSATTVLSVTCSHLRQAPGNKQQRLAAIRTFERAGNASRVVYQRSQFLSFLDRILTFFEIVQMHAPHRTTVFEVLQLLINITVNSLNKSAKLGKMVRIPG